MMYGELVAKFANLMENTILEDVRVKRTLFAYFEEAYGKIPDWTETEFYIDLVSELFPVRSDIYPEKSPAYRIRYMQHRLDMYTTIFAAWWYMREQGYRYK